ncbi:MAG: succinate--CoA ligase subunit beta [Hyphomicrobiaceae bacterium]
MNFVEYAGKALLRRVGIATPRGALAATPAEAERIAIDLGPCVVKAQVPTGKRGKAGGIKRAATPAEAIVQAHAILGMEIDGHKVETVLVEEQVAIAQELYAAVLNDPETASPLILVSAEGGMDIEEIAAEHPGALIRIAVDIRQGADPASLLDALPPAFPADRVTLAAELAKLYRAYRESDAELVEVNPLVVTKDGQLLALDCKLTIDDSALARQRDLAAQGSPDLLTKLEGEAQALGLKFIELDGEVGVLANGAGLTMTTMDAIRHFGGRPANFLEIGGESYTKATPALRLVLANPRVKALLVNFCGAFARTDVMAEGVVKAWEELKPSIPVVFTIHGTGEDEAIALVRSRLGIEPYDLMDDAVKAAVTAAAGRSA